MSPLTLGAMTFGNPSWGTSDEESGQIIDRYLGAFCVPVGLGWCPPRWAWATGPGGVSPGCGARRSRCSPT